MFSFTNLQNSIALAGNRTRASRVAGENSTTEPPMPHSHRKRPPRQNAEESRMCHIPVHHAGLWMSTVLKKLIKSSSVFENVLLWSGCIGGIVVSIAAFQAVDPGSIPGQCKVTCFILNLSLCNMLPLYNHFQSSACDLRCTSPNQWPFPHEVESLASF